MISVQAHQSVVVKCNRCTILYESSTEEDVWGLGIYFEK